MVQSSKNIPHKYIEVGRKNSKLIIIGITKVKMVDPHPWYSTHHPRYQMEQNFHQNSVSVWKGSKTDSVKGLRAEQPDWSITYDALGLFQNQTTLVAWKNFASRKAKY